jgi:RAP1 GTPase activating protein 1
MFHVSTLLPHSKIERQQLERKRHIGNDIVAIVFQESEIPFNPECITSQFLHVYLVITPLDNEGNQFKVSVIHRDGVPSFGPFTNHSKLFHCDQIFKQWLLTKLINAEMASCRTSIFQKYHVLKSFFSFLADLNMSFIEIGTYKNEFI